MLKGNDHDYGGQGDTRQESYDWKKYGGSEQDDRRVHQYGERGPRAESAVCKARSNIDPRCDAAAACSDNITDA